MEDGWVGTCHHSELMGLGNKPEPHGSSADSRQAEKLKGGVVRSGLRPLSSSNTDNQKVIIMIIKAALRRTTTLKKQLINWMARQSES